MIARVKRRLARARVALHLHRGRRARIAARYAEAEGDLLRARLLAASAFSPSSLEMVAPLNELGILYKYAGRFDEAEGCYRAALRILEGRRGQDATLACLYHNLGGVEHARGHYAEAETLARSGLALRVRALGPNHIDVIADEAALASILAAGDQVEEAEGLLRKAITEFAGRLGPGHYEVAANLNNLAAMLARRGDPATAAEMYQRALAIKERCLGTRHPEVAMILNNLAMLERARGKQDEAYRLADRAVAIACDSLPAGHPWREVFQDFSGQSAGGQHRNFAPDRFHSSDGGAP